VVNILKEFCNDEDVVVAESCMVALDAADYWGYGGGSESNQEQMDEGDGMVIKKEGQSDLVSKEATTDAVLTFVQQKAVTNGKISQIIETSNNESTLEEPIKDGLRNYFNYA